MLKMQKYQNVSVPCVDPTPANGQVNITSAIDHINTTVLTTGQYLANTRATFTCDSHSVFVGSTSSTCQTSEMWNPPPPRCIQGIKLHRLLNLLVVSLCGLF